MLHTLSFVVSTYTNSDILQDLVGVGVDNGFCGMLFCTNIICIDFVSLVLLQQYFRYTSDILLLSNNTHYIW